MLPDHKEAMNSADRKELIEDLSIAALTALLPGAGAGLIAVRPFLKMGLGLWDRSETQRQAQRVIVEAVGSWAAREDLGN
ncbi:MAG: hypothetical protein KIT69_05355, partial [Propionibacteriaceae bacterium]|nr:hypothetical protein [Propionibacteriaceae bacterium]